MATTGYELVKESIFKELIQDFHEAVDDYLELCAGK